MKKKPKKKQNGTLITGVIIPITDPAEKAELERRIREAEKMLSGGRSISAKGKTARRKMTG